MTNNKHDYLETAHVKNNRLGLQGWCHFFFVESVEVK